MEPMTTTQLAHEVARQMHWQAINTRPDEPLDPHHCRIRRADGLTLYFHVPWKKKNVEISLCLNGLGVYRETQIRIENEHKINCAPNPASVIRAIETNLLPSAAPVYQGLVDSIDQVARTKARQLRELQDLASAFGTEVKTGVKYRTDLDPSFSITMFDLTLDFEAGNRGFSLKGYCNTIPVDLMMRLVPVIKEWQAEKIEAAKVSHGI